jgi:hypothetical protein
MSAYLHIPYEDVYVAVMAIQPSLAKKGILLRHILAAAEALNRPLKVIRRPNLEDDSGVLGVMWTKTTGHWVVLLEGKILDSDPPQLWDASEYLATFKAKPGWLLTEDI